MFKFIILLSFFLVTLYAQEYKTENSLSYEKSISTLQNIEHDGIFYGSGEHLVYVFLDPLCPYSRKFISMLAKNEKMLLKYRYCIYLYSIPRLHSTGAVTAIYDSPTPLDTLLKIMLNDAKLSEMPNEKIALKISEIESV